MLRLKSFALVLPVGMMILLCSCSTSGDKDKLLFERWTYEMPMKPGMECRSYDSPDGQYALQKVYSDPDDNDFFVCLQDKRSSERLLIGHGCRSLGVDWYKTQFGYVAVIDHFYDTHENEIFVIHPKTLANGHVSYDLLYRTPEHYLKTQETEFPVDHSSWSVEGLSADGILTISGWWNFTDLDMKGNCEKFKIPLFYGNSDK